MTVLSTPGRIASKTAPDQVRAALTGRRADTWGTLFMLCLLLALFGAVAILAVLIFTMVGVGGSVLVERPVDFVNGFLRSQPESSGIAQGLRGTFWIGVITVVVAFPMGIASAIYLEEYAPHDSRVARIINIAIRNLAGVPSVVFGILGFTIFVKALGSITGPESGGRSVISGGLAIAILVLPIVIITTSEALRAVPQGLREAGFGVGATRWEVIKHHVLPYASPGIMTGTVLSLVMALGQAAPLILIGATSGYLTGGAGYGLGELQDRFTAMPIVISTWARRPGEGWEQITAAAILALLAVVFLANAAAILLRNRFEKKRTR